MSPLEVRAVDVQQLHRLVAQDPIGLDENMSRYLTDRIERDPRIELLLHTEVRECTGVFAAGDVRSGSIKRVASAGGEGAMAVRLVHEHRATEGQ